MKTLLVYYSRTGTTKKAALKIAEALSCESEEIKDVKSRAGVIGYLKSGREAMLKKLPLIAASKHDPKDYDLLIIGTPVWAAALSSPVRTYLTKEKDKIKKFALFITQGGRGAENVIKDVESIIGHYGEAALVLSTKEVVADLAKGKIDSFIKAIKG